MRHKGRPSRFIFSLLIEFFGIAQLGLFSGIGISSSAICTALVAAPHELLVSAHQRLMPFSCIQEAGCLRINEYDILTAVSIGIR